ncbi:glycoside hydrolase family 16 protein [Streptomyces sp. V1I1]|uniref:glycoside hydrolase family 16 protein n=1 Tax=Streptomyces sp. V1I1 TaxID=3042272 RepID=UPI0027D88530|nr:glycoside hydrolase family 16 protein [Streptomyces sp. V1I1]
MGTAPPSPRRRALFGALIAAALAVAGVAAGLFAAPAQGAAPAAPGWALQWSDDFNGAAGTLPSSTNWLFQEGHSYPGGPANWGTNEVQSFTKSTNNISLDGAGNLRITPLRDASGNWTSSRIETQRSDFKAPAGGTLRIEGRIQMPNVTGAAASGYWPAFWALGSPYRGNYWNWPGIGEYDIMENVNGMNAVFGTLHCGVNPGGPCNETTGLGNSRPCPNSTCQSGFHTYTFEWDRSVIPNQLRWYVDGVQFHSVSQNQVDATTWSNMTDHAGYFILLNVSIGGAFPDALGGPTPTAATDPGHPMIVDYVGVWSRTGATTTTPAPSPTSTPPPSGSPTLYLRSDGGLGSSTGTGSTVTVASGGGTNHDGTPYLPQTFLASGITRTYNGGATQFDLSVDAGTAVGDGQQIRVSYDLTGDGSWDRTETYNYFATDPVTGYEHYTQSRGLKSATGTLGDLASGKVKVEVWNAIGNAPSTIGTGNQSVVAIPFT